MVLPTVLALGVCHAPLAAQVLDPSFTSPATLYAPGQVNAFGPQQADGKRLVSGSFTRANGTPVSRLVRLAANGALDLPFTQNVGTVNFVYRIKGYANGQYLLCGSGGSVAAGGITRTEFLRLNADGTPDAGFDAGSGPGLTGSFGHSQDCVIRPNGSVVVVGAFDAYSSTPAAGVVQLTASGSVDATFSVGTGLTANGSIKTAYAVALQPDGKVLVGGNFAVFNGQPAVGIVRLLPNGSVDPTFASPLQAGSQVENLVLQPDGNVLVNGLLNVSGTPPATVGLVRLLPSGTVDASFSGPAFLNAKVTTGYNDPAVVLQSDGKVLVVGPFASSSANYVARLNADGTLDNIFSPGAVLSGMPASLGLQADGTVLVGGSFNTFNGTEASLGRLTSSGGVDPAFAAQLQLPGVVTALSLQPNGQVIAGGNFTEWNGQAVHRLVRLTTSGALDGSFSSATGVLPGAVTCLALQPDGKALAGTLQGIRRFTPGGNPDVSFASSLNTTALAGQPDGRIMVGGNFASVSGGVSYSRLARLTSTGALDPTFARVVTGASTGALVTVDALLVQPDGRIVVGGNYTSTSQPIVTRVVRYDASGGIDVSFRNNLAFTTTSGASSPTNRVNALALQADGQLLVGGSFGAVDGLPKYGVARLEPGGNPDGSFVTTAPLNGTVSSVALQPNGRVLVGGTFTYASVAGPVPNLVRVLRDGQNDGSFGATVVPNGPVRTMALQPDGAILLGGAFTSVGNQPSIGVARIVAPNVLHVATPSPLALTANVWPVPAHDRLHVAVAAHTQPVTLILLDAIGRQVRNRSLTNETETTVEIADLPTGIYFLQVRYSTGTVSRQLLIN